MWWLRERNQLWRKSWVFRFQPSRNGRLETYWGRYLAITNSRTLYDLCRAARRWKLQWAKRTSQERKSASLWFMKGWRRWGRFVTCLDRPIRPKRHLDQSGVNLGRR